MIYLLGWIGGYDPPSFKALHSVEAAKQLARSWANDADESDTVLLLAIDPGDLSLTVIDYEEPHA